VIRLLGGVQAALQIRELIMTAPKLFAMFNAVTTTGAAAAATSASTTMPGGTSAPGGVTLGQAAQVAGTAAAEEATEEAEEVASETATEEAPTEETPPETVNETPPEETPETAPEETTAGENTEPAPGICTPNEDVPSQNDAQREALLQAVERGDYEAVRAIVEKDQSLVHRVLLENGLVGDGASSGVTGSASPVLGDFDVGFWKRVGNAIPGFNFDSVEDQADIETYNSDSAFGIDGLTHGDIYDFSMTSAEYLGYAELGLSAGNLRAFIRNIGANNRKYAPNSKPSVLGHALTDADRAALHHYTTSAYRDINEVLRGSSGLPPWERGEIRAMADRISEGLAKLAAQPGTTYRGVTYSEDVLARYQPGSVVTEHAFTSTSRDVAVAQGTFDGNVLMNVVGRDVAPFSTYPEVEILYDKGTQFQVTGRTWESDIGKWVINLEEM
jgi:hypothetical protein